MAGQPERARLRSYLQGNNHSGLDAAGANWEQGAWLLQQTAQAISQGARTVRDGDGHNDGLGGETAQALLAAFVASSASMQDKSSKMQAASSALRSTRSGGPGEGMS